LVRVHTFDGPHFPATLSLDEIEEDVFELTGQWVPIEFFRHGLPGKSSGDEVIYIPIRPPDLEKMVLATGVGRG
jgi:hypothetical protein